MAEIIHSGFQGEVWLLLQKEEKNCMNGLQKIASVYLSTACLVVKVKKKISKGRKIEGLQSSK